jgi:hypothetical protein
MNSSIIMNEGKPDGRQYGLINGYYVNSIIRRFTSSIFHNSEISHSHKH